MFLKTQDPLRLRRFTEAFKAAGRASSCCSGGGSSSSRRRTGSMQAAADEVVRLPDAVRGATSD
jgi:hypothetical protein